MIFAAAAGSSDTANYPMELWDAAVMLATQTTSRLDPRGISTIQPWTKLSAGSVEACKTGQVKRTMSRLRELVAIGFN